MTRIYFKPQGGSSRSIATGASNRARKPTIKGQMQRPHQQHKHPKDAEDYHRDGDGWRDKLEPSAIEQIADGLEKMVLSWTYHPTKVQQGDSQFNLLHGHEDLHGLLSSDAIKSATMEIVGNGDQFSIGAKETTISFVHHHEQHHLHNHHQGFQPHPHKHCQQTLIVDTIGEADGFMQDLMNGDILNNGLLSLQNGDCDAADYQTGSAVGATSALWYLSPTLALPNTLSYGKNFGRNHLQKCQDVQSATCTDGANSNGTCEVLHDERREQDGKLESEPCNSYVQENNTLPHVGYGVEKWQADSIASQKIPCKLEALGSTIWSETVEINGGNKIKELLGRKLAAFGANGFSSSEGTGLRDADYYKKKVEELQIALLECAMEYEVKIVEMKMLALHSKSQERQTESLKEKNREESETGHAASFKERRDAQRVEYLKKQLSRLQREKAVAARELSDLRKRERQFDLQRRSLDDALSRVNFLQSELARKEQEILDCRLREKEAKAQLYELQLGLQKAQAAQIEPRKLLTLLPALKDWIQSSKKGPHDVAACEKTEVTPQIDNIVFAITKEIQMLQNALSHVINKA